MVSVAHAVEDSLHSARHHNGHHSEIAPDAEPGDGGDHQSCHATPCPLHWLSGGDATVVLNALIPSRRAPIVHDNRVGRGDTPDLRPPLF